MSSRVCFPPKEFKIWEPPVPHDMRSYVVPTLVVTHRRTERILVVVTWKCYMSKIRSRAPDFHERFWLPDPPCDSKPSRSIYRIHAYASRIYCYKVKYHQSAATSNRYQTSIPLNLQAPQFGTPVKYAYDADILEPVGFERFMEHIRASLCSMRHPRHTTLAQDVSTTSVRSSHSVSCNAAPSLFDEVAKQHPSGRELIHVATDPVLSVRSLLSQAGTERG